MTVNVLHHLYDCHCQLWPSRITGLDYWTGLVDLRFSSPVYYTSPVQIADGHQRLVSQARLFLFQSAVCWSPESDRHCETERVWLARPATNFSLSRSASSSAQVIFRTYISYLNRIWFAKLSDMNSDRPYLAWISTPSASGSKLYEGQASLVPLFIPYA